MALTARQLNRATLARQLLLRREALDVADAVRRVVAVQAQEPASPYVALWNRVADFDPADLDAAFADHAVVKATLMRITLHAVHATDRAAFHAAMLDTLRPARLNDRRFKATGLTTADADALVPDLVAFASRPRTVAEIEAWVTEQVGPRPAPGPWWALRSLAPLVHAPTDAPWSFGRRPSFVAPRTPPAQDPVVATQHLIWRYLEGFGPATMQDFGQFALLRRPAVTRALPGLVDRLVTIEGPDGIPLLDVPDAPLPADDAHAPPRLMAMWDSTLLAHVDRGRVIPAAYRQLVMRRNGDVLPTLLVDGFVAGVWRPTDDGIEATAFHALDTATWEALAAEARDLLTHLTAREPGAYRRYGHWWSQLPAVEVHTLA